jgi:3-phosphoshikimate 1-carboxyvinyltransferase
LAVSQLKEISVLSKVNLKIKVPGSKSITNRALVLASLAKGKSKIISPLESDDTKYLLNALSLCGIKIQKRGNGFSIYGRNGEYITPKQDLFIGNAGTTMRFLTSLLCFGEGVFNITCEERMKERPIKDLVEALTFLGADITYTEKQDYPPLKIKGAKLTGDKITIPGSKSSQYISSVLMVAPLFENGLIINIEGELVSKPYIDTTINVMKDFGVEIENNEYQRFIIKPGQKYKRKNYLIQGDASSASYFMAAAAICSGECEISNVGYKCNQGDINFAYLLEKMGAKVNVKRHKTFIKSDGRLKGIKCDLNNTPDVVQTLAVVALYAEGETLIENVYNLRIKETDRLDALEKELTKMGADVKTGRDWIKITPRISYKPAEIKTYNDHRMAMSFALAGLKTNGIRILNPEVVSKSYPLFFDDFNKLYK